MARKRKTRASEAQQEPEPVQTTEPEPEIEAAQPDPQETHQIPEEPQTEEELVNEDEEQDDEEEEVEQDGEEEQPDNTEELKNDAVVATEVKDEQMTEKPSENASENGADAEEEDDDDEEEEDEEPLEKLLEPFSKDQLTLLIKEAVAKHPDLVENVHKLADVDPAHRKIFVHGLGWEANSETITSVFGKYGEIEDCKVVKDKISGKSKGYGFILFKHRAGARKALKEPQKTIDGRLASCQLASAGPVHTPPTPAAAAASSVSTLPASEYTQRKIYVSNVSAELDTKKLTEFFSKFGEIEDGPLGLDKQTGKPRGFCLYVYKSLDSAKKALEEPHKTFDGQILHCQKAVDGPKHTKGGFFNQQQQHGQQQQQQHHHQGHYGHHAAKKGRYAGNSGGGGGMGPHMGGGGHMMAPSGGAGTSVPGGFNPGGVAPAAIGQAVAALLAGQGAGLGIGNFLGGMGAGGPQGGIPPMMGNAGGYGVQGGYGGQPGMQGGYGGQPQAGQGGVRPYQGGAPYMGRGGGR